VLPGFVDSHTHPVFAGSRAEEFAARVAGRDTYAALLARGEGGILSTVAATRAASDDDLLANLRTRADTFLRYGTTTVEVWSDFKRHDVGASLSDSKAFKEIAGNFFITPPLWGVADTAPYLHDGRAATLSDAILQHDGEGAAAASAFAALTADQQAEVVEFLGTLSRATH